MPSQPSPNPRHKWSPRRQTDIVCATHHYTICSANRPRGLRFPMRLNAKEITNLSSKHCKTCVAIAPHAMFYVTLHGKSNGDSGSPPTQGGSSAHPSLSPYGASLALPQSTSLAWHRLNDCLRADCQTIKRIAFHRKVTNFGLHATACNSGVPSNWHHSVLQNDSHLSPTCQTLTTSQSFGR